MSKAIAVAVALVLGAGLCTYVAGEQTEVVVVRTFDGAGAPHDTKVWAVDHDGDVWVRVANPRRGWLQRLRANPRAELVRAGRTQAVTAEPDETPATRAAVDRVFRAKYGAVDWWYGVLLRRDAVPVRLRAEQPPASE